MYKELVKQLRSTVSRSKRTLFDDAADAIEQLQKELREERYRHDRLQDFEGLREEGWCNLHNCIRKLDSYCSYGERRK